MDDVYDLEVEVTERTVEDAKAVALERLGLPADRVDFTVLSEGKGGFLGIGSQPAVVVARAKPPEKKRTRRRRRRGGRGKPGEARGAEPKSQQEGDRKARSGNGGRGQQQKAQAGARRSGNGRRSEGRSENKKADKAKQEKPVTEDAREETSIEDQGAVAKEFLEGLLDAFGLEGTVTTNTEDDILLIDVSGDQTEALVGNRGAIMQSVLELTRTVVQRKTFGAPRMRLDIAGYGTRRREALRIYTAKLADSVLESGGEVMLEPMNPADRKVVHDAIGEIDGVRSFSEGEEPNRSVVIASEGPPAARADAAEEDDSSEDRDEPVVDDADDTAEADGDGDGNGNED